MFIRLVSAIVLPAAIVALLGASAAWSAPASPNARRCEPNCPKQGPSRAEFASEDDAFIAARNAVNKPDPARFEQAAAQVGRSYPLEIQPLAEQVNRLLAHNQETVERQRTHVGNLAHALKTPLAVLSSAAARETGPLSGLVVQQASANLRHARDASQQTPTNHARLAQGRNRVG
jgi:signal transduction histidine kinase